MSANPYGQRLQQIARNRTLSPPPKPKTIPPPVQPLIEQIRDYFATLPKSQKEKVSIPAILPHLQGKYADQPHNLHVARALKQLGYTPIRSWKSGDAGHRYWIPSLTTGQHISAHSHAPNAPK